MRVVGGIHQHVVAEQVADCAGQRRPLRDLDALEIAPARHIFARPMLERRQRRDRKSTRLNSSHSQISYAVFCLKKKKTKSSHAQRAKCNTTVMLNFQY